MTTTTTKTFRLHVSPGSRADVGRIFATIEYTEDGRLSICGVEGPLPSGNARGSCGQCHPLKVGTFAAGWTPELLARFNEVWDRWHLNDCRAGCEHQRAAWNILEPLEVVSYGLTAEAHRAREKARHAAALAHVRGEPCELTETAKALVALTDWYEDRHAPPDADSPLSGCYEVKKRETRPACHVLPTEHPRGLLTKPCEVCGYRYGSAWLREEVPADILDFLRSLPDAGALMPTRWARP